MKKILLLVCIAVTFVLAGCGNSSKKVVSGDFTFTYKIDADRTYTDENALKIVVEITNNGEPFKYIGNDNFINWVYLSPADDKDICYYNYESRFSNCDSTDLTFEKNAKKSAHFTFTDSDKIPEGEYILYVNVASFSEVHELPITVPALNKRGNVKRKK